MNDLSMHILDIVQNSISAGATRVSLTVDENPAADLLTIVIGDNGRGMTPEQVSRLSDPFSPRALPVRWGWAYLCSSSPRSRAGERSG